MTVAVFTSGEVWRATVIDRRYSFKTGLSQRPISGWQDHIIGTVSMSRL